MDNSALGINKLNLTSQVSKLETAEPADLTARKSGNTSAFGQLLHSLEPKPTQAPENLSGQVEKALELFTRDWSGAERSLGQQIKSLPKSGRSFIELQLTFHRLHMSSEMFSKASETVSSTLRRLQQMGAN